MSPDLRQLFRKLAILLAPFAVYAAAVLVIDPYNYFNLFASGGDTVKKDVSYKLNYAMWSMIEFRREPAPDILLGDSRMLALDAAAVSAVTGAECRNLAYGGGSLKEALATFRFADRTTDLAHVTIGLDVNTYNGSDTKDRVSEVEAALRNPLLYLTNNTVMKAAWTIVTARLTGREVNIGQPVGDRQSFWRQQLDVTARMYLANYRDPISYREQLKEVSETCRAKGIGLQFIIFPSHQDLMDKIGEYGLEQANESMRRDLASWGTVYDFAWPNAVTADTASFTDPFHFTQDVAHSIIRTVWGGSREHVKVYGLGGAEPGQSTLAD